MADGAFVQNTPHSIDDVMRRQSSGLVNDKDAIHEGIGQSSNFVIGYFGNWVISAQLIGSKGCR